MIDWWQALILSVAGAVVGGLITLTVSYATHGWATKAALEAAERETARRAAEEERQARRRYRRERIQPILDFLEVAKKYFADETVAEIAAKVYSEGKDDASRRALERELKAAYKAPDMQDLSRAFRVAEASVASMPHLELALKTVFYALLREQRQAPEGNRRASEAISQAEQLAEDYVTEV